MNVQTHNAASQALTLVSAISVGNEWSSSDLSKLQSLKAQGVAVATIALELKRSYYGVSTKLTELGLTAPRVTKPQPVEVACDACWLIHRGECP
jgi:hypothetical protein